MKITLSVIRNCLTVNILCGLFFGYFLKFYLEIDKNLLKHVTSKALLCELICCGIICIFNIIKLVKNIFNYNKSINKNKYERYLYFNNIYIKHFYDINFAISCLISMIFVPYFFPVKNNICNGYSQNICGFAIFYFVIGICAMIIYTAILIKIIYLLCQMCYSRSIDITSSIHNLYCSGDYNVLNVNQLNIIYLDLDNEICPICLEEGYENDKTFAELKCGHKLHKNCLNNLIQSNAQNNCPTCRQPFNATDIVNYHDIELIDV